MNVKHTIFFAIGWPLLVAAGVLWAPGSAAPNLVDAGWATLGGYAACGWFWIAQGLRL